MQDSMETVGRRMGWLLGWFAIGELIFVEFFLQVWTYPVQLVAASREHASTQDYTNMVWMLTSIPWALLAVVRLVGVAETRLLPASKYKRILRLTDSSGELSATEMSVLDEPINELMPWFSMPSKFEVSASRAADIVRCDAYRLRFPPGQVELGVVYVLGWLASTFLVCHGCWPGWDKAILTSADGPLFYLARFALVFCPDFIRIFFYFNLLWLFGYNVWLEEKGRRGGKTVAGHAGASEAGA